MFEQFTVEEINMICVFDISDREALIAGIVDALPDFDEPELDEIAIGVLKKLIKMSDADFGALELYPEYEDYDEEV